MPTGRRHGLPIPRPRRCRAAHRETERAHQRLSAQKMHVHAPLQGQEKGDSGNADQEGCTKFRAAAAKIVI